MENIDKFQTLFSKVKELYNKHKAELLFHGWHHVTFVSDKAAEFAATIGADVEIVRATGLVHDINYIVQPNSEPEAGKEIREKILQESGYSDEDIARIETIIMEAHTGTRSEVISEEGKALSDADTLFKSLPTTPILFASKYITQNKVDVYKLAEKVTSEQNPLMDKGIYFYTEAAKTKYLPWAKGNLLVWNYVMESFTDPAVKKMLETAKEMGVL